MYTAKITYDREYMSGTRNIKKFIYGVSASITYTLGRVISDI